MPSGLEILSVGQQYKTEISSFKLPGLSRCGLNVCGTQLGGWEGVEVTTVPNLNLSCIELELGVGSRL